MNKSILMRIREISLLLLGLLCLVAGSVAQADGSTATYFVHTDHLGTPQVMTDINQDIVWEADYNPFGKAIVTTELVENNVRFPGQYFDEETGLHYNYFRDYDPLTGRYIESDPIGLSGGLNTYSYVANNPIRYSDRLGLVFPGVGAGGGAGGLSGFGGIGGFSGTGSIDTTAPFWPKLIREQFDPGEDSKTGSKEPTQCKAKRCKYDGFFRILHPVSPGPTVTDDDPIQFHNLTLTCFYSCPEGFRKRQYFFTVRSPDFAEAFRDSAGFCKRRTP